MAPITQALPMTLSPELDFDQNAASALGSSLASRYIQATPFPHIVIDNFLNEELIAVSAHTSQPSQPTTKCSTSAAIKVN